MAAAQGAGHGPAETRRRSGARRDPDGGARGRLRDRGPAARGRAQGARPGLLRHDGLHDAARTRSGRRHGKEGAVAPGPYERAAGALRLMIFLFGLAVGAVLGLTGAGGSILAVPLLVAGLGWTLPQAAPVAL